jgi:hypothetical protein
MCHHRAMSAPDVGTEEHRTHPAHDHEHGPWCGHATVRHGDHLDYLHEGHVHQLDTDHVDEVEAAVAALHLPHTGHMHVHGEGCGHAPVAHADHVDYEHGEHRHASHDDHYDEH